MRRTTVAAAWAKRDHAGGRRRAQGGLAGNLFRVPTRTPPAWAGESRSCLACLQAVGPVHLHLHLGPKSPLAFPAPVAAPRASHLKAPVASSAFLSSTSTASPDGIDQPNAQPHQRRLQRASEFAVDALSIPDELFDVESPPQAN
ncbi:hypothetical protein SCUP234_11909 [Seiridium cupressi]